MKTPEQLKGTIRSMAAKKNLRAQEVLQMFLFERVLERLASSAYWEDPFVSHEDVIAKLLLPESEERNSRIICASLVGDAHKERSSGLNCTGRPFFSFGGTVTDG